MFRDADPVESQFVGQAQLFLRSAHGFADRLTIAQGWRHRPGRCRGVARIRHRIQKARLHSGVPSRCSVKQFLLRSSIIPLLAGHNELDRAEEGNVGWISHPCKGAETC